MKPSGMKAVKAIQDCGGGAATAQLLGLTVRAVYKWDTYVPRRHVEKITAHVAAMKGKK